jgi:hypothetical protein
MLLSGQLEGSKSENSTVISEKRFTRYLRMLLKAWLGSGSSADFERLSGEYIKGTSIFLLPTLDNQLEMFRKLGSFIESNESSSIRAMLVYRSQVHAHGLRRLKNTFSYRRMSTHRTVHK